MTEDQTRRAFLTIGLHGVVGLLVACWRRPGGKTGDSGSPRDTLYDTGRDAETGSPPPGDTAPSPDTATSQDTAASQDSGSSGSDTGTRTVCTETSDNIEGPFWIEGVPVRTEYDLYGHWGTSLSISGQVLDLACAPIPGVIIEIWHADPEGIYDNSSPERHYRGQMAADAEGRFAFHTLKPGWYLNGARYRPSHIHFKIWLDGLELKTTQLYFEDDPFIEGDAFVVDDLVLPLTDDGSGGLIGSFEFAVDRG